MHSDGLHLRVVQVLCQRIVWWLLYWSTCALVASLPGGASREARAGEGAAAAGGVRVLRLVYRGLGEVGSCQLGLNRTTARLVPSGVVTKHQTH